MKRIILLFILSIGLIITAYGQTISDVIEYSNTLSFAHVTVTQKVYTRDSFNSAWFDRHKENRTPALNFIRRYGNGNGTVAVTFHDEFQFDTTIYDKQNDKVVSIECRILFLGGSNVYQYAPQNDYDRIRNVDEPGGKYRLIEYSRTLYSQDSTNNFILLYNMSLNGNGLATAIFQ